MTKCTSNKKSYHSLEMTIAVHGESHGSRTVISQGLLSACHSEVTSHCRFVADINMAQSAPLILRLVASSITAVNRAGKIIRDIMSQGDLGIVEKVGMCQLWHTGIKQAQFFQWESYLTCQMCNGLSI
jgi:hypothetical protein